MSLEYNISKILEEMELELVKNYKKYMALGIDKGPGYWRDRQLQNFKRYKKENKQIIDYYIKLTKEEVTKGLREAYKDGTIEVFNREKYDDKYFLDDINSRKMNALLNVVHNDMKEAIFAAMRLTNDVYRKNIFKAMVHMDSGLVTLKQAVDTASSDFLAKGINCIEYSNGRKVDICSYSEMAIRTNSHRAKIMGESDQAQELGINYCYVSSHGVTCDKCARWQGLWLFDDVYGDTKPSRKNSYPLLSEAISDGLFHPNCRHSLIYGDPEGEKPKSKERTEEDKKKYKNEQIQRSIEREIRKVKREMAGLQDPAAIAKKQKELRERQAEMREFLKDKDYLTRRYDRETSKTAPNKR